MDEISESEDEGVDLQNLSEDSSDDFNNNIEWSFYFILSHLKHLEYSTALSLPNYIQLM